MRCQVVSKNAARTICTVLLNLPFDSKENIEETLTDEEAPLEPLPECSGPAEEPETLRLLLSQAAQVGVTSRKMSQKMSVAMELSDWLWAYVLNDSSLGTVVRDAAMVCAASAAPIAPDHGPRPSPEVAYLPHVQVKWGEGGSATRCRSMEIIAACTGPLRA